MCRLGARDYLDTDEWDIRSIGNYDKIEEKEILWAKEELSWVELNI